MTVNYGIYTFRTTYDPKVNAYQVVKPDSFTTKGHEASYEELKDKYFTVTKDGNKYTIGFKKLQKVEGGEGPISGDSLKGGYKEVNGGLLFVDNVNDKTGIFYMEDRAVAFTTEGEFYYVNINYAREENGNIINDLSQATLMYGPQMAQARDPYGTNGGSLMYTKLKFQYKDPANNDAITCFDSDGVDSTYQEVLAKLTAAGEDYVKSLQPVGLKFTADGKIDFANSKLVYDTNSDPVYTAVGQVQAKDASGKYLYVGADGTIFSHEKNFETLSADSEAIAEVLRKHGQFTAYYYYPKGTVTIAPAGTDGMNITYMPYSGSGNISFGIDSDSNGYGIVDRYTRVILTNNHTSGLPQGTLLYLDQNGNVVGAYTPNGLLRIYDKGSSLGGTEAYTEVNGSTIHMSSGAKFNLHQAATGVYMAPQSIGEVSMMAVNSNGPVSRYFHSDYFSDSGSSLVQLKLGAVLTMNEEQLTAMGFKYPNDTVKNLFNGAYVSAVTDANGNVAMYVLERKDGTASTEPTTMVLLPDGTWYASDSTAGVLQSISNRKVEDLEQTHTLVEMTDTLAGESITILFGGENTTLNDNEDHHDSDGDGIGDSNYANVITNNLKIIATDNGNIFEEKDPMVLKPFSGDTTNLQIVGAGTNGAYGGVAYAQTLLEANVNLHDTDVSDSGSIDLELYKGDIGFENVTQEDGGKITANVENGGDVTMENVSVLGDGQGSEGALTVSTKEGNVTIGKANGDNSHDIIVSGVVDVKTGKGSISLTDADVSGRAGIISNGAGSITATDVDVSGTANLKTNGDGAVTVGDLNVNANANTTITTNGKGDISIKDSTVSGNAVISNNRNPKGSVTGNGSGKVEMEHVTISGTADVSTGAGDMSLTDGNISGTASITSGGDGAITMQTVKVPGNLAMTNAGTGAVTMDEIKVSGTATVSTGAGDMSLTDADISGTASITSGGDGAIKPRETASGAKAPACPSSVR